MRKIDDILRNIENAKLDVPSNEYLEVKMGDLETLYTKISTSNSLLATKEIKIIAMEQQISALKEKIELLNDLATISHKRLDNYA